MFKDAVFSGHGVADLVFSQNGLLGLGRSRGEILLSLTVLRSLFCHIIDLVLGEQEVVAEGVYDLLLLKARCRLVLPPQVLEARGILLVRPAHGDGDGQLQNIRKRRCSFDSRTEIECDKIKT